MEYGDEDRLIRGYFSELTKHAAIRAPAPAAWIAEKNRCRREKRIQVFSSIAAVLVFISAVAMNTAMPSAFRKKMAEPGTVALIKEGYSSGIRTYKTHLKKAN